MEKCDSKEKEKNYLMTTWKQYVNYCKFSGPAELANTHAQIEDWVELGHVIREQRKKLGISRKRLAKLCKVSKSTIKEVEWSEVGKRCDGETVLNILIHLQLSFSIDPRPEEKKLPLYLEIFLKRKKLGISRKELSQICETSKSTIKELELNGKLPNMKTLLKIMHYLDFTFNISTHSIKN